MTKYSKNDVVEFDTVNGLQIARLIQKHPEGYYWAVTNDNKGVKIHKDSIKRIVK